jgi:hypothetical protein
VVPYIYIYITGYIVASEGKLKAVSFISFLGFVIEFVFSVVTIFLVCLFCSNTSHHLSSVTGCNLEDHQELMLRVDPTSQLDHSPQTQSHL